MTDAQALETRRLHLFALLLSVAAHLGLGFVVSTRGGMAAGMTADLSVQAKPLTIYLSASDSTRLTSTLVASGSDKPLDEPPLYQPRSSPAAQRSSDAPSALPIGAQVSLHYFQFSELTQEPLVVHGLVGDKILVVSEVSPQSISLQVWVNDQGNVERVIIENSHLSGDTERLVTDAFSKVKFIAGKIGRIPVRSQLRMEILLEDAVRL